MFSHTVNYCSFINHHCLLCSGKTTDGLLICQACNDDLPWLLHACRQCAEPLSGGEGASRCGRCLKRPPAFDASLVPLRYQHPVNRVVAALKNQGQLPCIDLAAQLFVQRFGQQIRQCPPQLIVPVPLHRRRLYQRGYNQATEWSRALARLLDIPSDQSLCRRHLDTPHQQGLSASARRRNLRNAFHLNRAPEQTHIALVDDVITTGSTLDALAAILKKQGVERVDAWCLARTPAHD